MRRCHGDLHLRNIVLIDGRPVLFDALEFDERLATSDVLYDLAFLLMDLWQRGLTEAANGVRNRWLWQRDDISDIAGCRALPLFMSLRAAIRAKVTVDSLPHLDSAAQRDATTRALHYFETAEACMTPVSARLVGVGGLSGTGKTTLAACLAPRLRPVPGAVHLRSDIERKRLFAVADTDRLPEEAYRMPVTEKVYARLREKTAAGLAAGQSVVVDAVHQRRDERAALEAVAGEAGADFRSVWLVAPDAELLHRVETRRGDASDADPDVVRRQIAHAGDVADWTRVDADGDRDAVCARASKAISQV